MEDTLAIRFLLSGSTGKKWAEHERINREKETQNTQIGLEVEPNQLQLAEHESSVRYRRADRTGVQRGRPCTWRRFGSRCGNGPKPV